MSENLGSTWKGCELVLIAGELALMAVMDDRVRIMPITEKLATALNAPYDFREFLFKRQKDTEDLIDSGLMNNLKWLKKHMKFVGAKGTDLGDWPVNFIKDIQKQSESATVKRRLSKIFANAFIEENACITHSVKDLEDIENFDRVKQLLVDDFPIDSLKKHENIHQESSNLSKIQSKKGRRARQFGNGKGIDDAIAKLIRNICQIGNKGKFAHTFIISLIGEKKTGKSTSTKIQKKS